MAIEINPETDHTIDVTDLTKEFRNFPPTMFAYCESKANAEHEFDVKKAEYEELKSKIYMELRSKEGKVTEKTLEAMIDTNPEVKKAQRDMLEHKRDLETLKGYIESLRAKKDMLIQLGSDKRKEM